MKIIDERNRNVGSLKLERNIWMLKRWKRKYGKCIAAFYQFLSFKLHTSKFSWNGILRYFQRISIYEVFTIYSAHDDHIKYIVSILWCQCFIGGFDTSQNYTEIKKTKKKYAMLLYLNAKTMMYNDFDKTKRIGFSVSL